jgi:hypothetical protein
LNQQIQSLVKAQFSESEKDEALRELQSITLSHVMANSQFNLDNTWLAVLQLSKGDLPKLREMVAAAKADFRDVIYWSTMTDHQ